MGFRTSQRKLMNPILSGSFSSVGSHLKELEAMGRMLKGISRFLLVCCLAVGFIQSAQAIDLTKESGLQFAPHDADFFGSTLRLNEQFQGIASSKFVQELLKTPYIQKAIDKFGGQWESRDGEIGRFRNNLENPAIESLLKLGRDMISEEVFVIGDGTWSEFFLEVSSLSNDATKVIESSGPEATVEFFLNLPKAELDAIPVPGFVVGFKLSDPNLLMNKLDELEGILRFGLAALPPAQPLLEGLERVQDSKGPRLAWTLKSDMIPWELIPRPDDTTAAIVEKIQDSLEDRQICFTLGALKEYLIIGISENAEAIGQLGDGDGLAKHPHMKPVLDRANEKITSIGYASDLLAAAQFEVQLNNYFSRQLVPQYKLAEIQYGNIPPEFESIPDDLAWLDEQIAQHVPEQKGQTAVSFMNDKGNETWVYSRTKNVVFDSSKPLSILNQLGGDPMAMLAVRLQDHPEYFATARRIVRKVKEYLDLVPDLDILSEDERAQWEVGLEKGWPILVDLADLWENEFMPSMKDGQHAWVLGGGNLSSKQWFKDMPPSNHDLPLPEIALVTGLSDRDGMSNAFKHLFEILDGVVEIARELDPEKVPSSYSIPRPTRDESVSTNARYVYPIPDDCPVPKSMALQALLGDKFMISAYSDKQVDELSKSKSLSIGQGILQSKQNCSSVAYFDFGRIAAYVKPWVVYSIETNAGELESTIVPEDDKTPELKGSDIVGIWDAFQHFGKAFSVSFQEKDGTTVTRSVITE
jgi:hypothetical protein